MGVWEGYDLGKEENWLERDLELDLQKGALAMGAQSLIPVFAGQTGIIMGGDNHRRARSTTQATHTIPRI